jgi:hypothetical protein
MVLDERTRGRLEQIIDNFIQGTPNIVKSLFDPQERARWQIQNQNDFSMGLALGIIFGGFWCDYITTYHKNPTQEEQKEVKSIIFRRMSEVRNAIFDVG